MHPVYDRPKEVKLLKWAKEGSELHKLELHPSQWKCGDYTAAGIRAAVILDTLTFIKKKIILEKFETKFDIFRDMIQVGSAHC